MQYYHSKPIMSIYCLLFVCIISIISCLKTNELTSSHSKSLIQTNLKLRTLSSYLHEYSQLILSLSEITNKTTLYAYYNRTSQQISIHPSKQTSSSHTAEVLVATATYNQNRFKTGWDIFSSETYNTANPIIQCYSVGILEGLLSFKEIHSYRHNFEYFFHSHTDIPELKNLFKQADENIKNKINSFGYSDDFAPKIDDIKSISYLSCLHAQINGLYKGYSLIAPYENKLDLYDIYLLNSEGYFSGLQAFLKVNNIQFKSANDFFNNKTLLEFYNTTRIEEIWKQLIHRSHCSGIVKYIKSKNVKGNDVILGHNTWTGYNELLRVLKKVNYAFEGDKLLIGMKPTKMKYSSYPGVLFSGDEFYTLNSNIAVIQTSLSIINYFQYKNAINLQTYVPEFMRIMIINFLSKTGTEWVNNYMKLFKGNHLYETQWVVIDYNKINSDKELMYIVEEVPKSVRYVDYSGELKEKGYYGSFNVPYFKEGHADIAGLNAFQDVDFYNKKYNPRQFILDKLISKVNGIKSFKEVLMYNGYHVKQKEFEDDPSYEDASNGIASREGGGSGAIDFKIVNKELMSKGIVWVYSGPVYDSNKNFKPYDVNKAERKLQKYSMGIPKVWDFKPFYFK